MNILMLNGENVQVVCAARALKKLGHKVFILASEKCSSGYVTRYVDGKSLICDYKNTKEALDTIDLYCKKIKIDVIIPTGDASAAFLSKYKNHFPGISCLVPDYDKFEIANDKWNLLKLCQENNISTPRTLSISVDNIDLVSEYVGFPALIKPNLSAGARGITKVNDFKELKLLLPNVLQEFGECTLQEYIVQPPYYYNVMLYRDKGGKVRGKTVIKIRRYFPLKGGSSCYCETIKDDELVDMCTKVLELLDWRGFADFDILEDAATGKRKIIEINPRFPSSLQAAFAAGVNFPKIMLADEFGFPHDQINYKEGKQVRWLGLDFMWLVFSSERFSFKPSWFKLIGKNVSYHDISWTDPLPFFAGVFSGLKKYFNPEFRKSKLR